MERIIPSILTILNMGASLVYLSNGNYPKAVYWFGAFLINATVAWWLK